MKQFVIPVIAIQITPVIASCRTKRHTKQAETNYLSEGEDTMKSATRISMTLAAIATIGTLLAAPVFAQTTTTNETQWQKDHPRRDQVNGRLENQNKRITNEVKEGEMSKAQAKSLRANDKTIHSEEKAMASQDHGHITKTDQKALNQQLNQNSAAIGK